MQWDLNVLQPDPTMKKPTLVYNVSGVGLKYGFCVGKFWCNTCLCIVLVHEGYQNEAFLSRM